MLIIQVFIHVKEQHLEPFKEATKENARHSKQEPGVARFDFLQYEDDPTRFVLTEVYRDADAAVKHKETAHYLAWAEKTADMFVAPRTRQRYLNLFPDDGGF